MADGYDMVVYGATLPKILEEPDWHLTHSAAGLIGTWTLGGLMVGFLTAGPLADRIGRRRIMLVGVVWIAIGSLLSAAALNVGMFGAARFLTGIGIGSIVPSAVALTLEYAPKHRRQLYNGAMLTGFSFGGIVASLAAIWLLPHYDWRILFGLGAVFLLLIPVMWFRLPESAGFLAAQGREAEARELAESFGLDYHELNEQADDSPQQEASAGGSRRLLERPLLAPLVVFIMMCVCVNVVVYGLNTWAPALMREQGYALGSSLTFMLALQSGGVVGAVIGAYFADRIGCGRVVMVMFGVGALSLLLLSNKMDTGWMLLAILGAGIGGTGTNSIIYGFVAHYFPVENRGAAVGVVLGLGRIGAMAGPAMAGWILDAGLGAQWSFYAFAAPAVIGAALVALLLWLSTQRDTTGGPALASA
ncbi:MFS transporter [Nocardia mikamii]|uniref:MFS transporter n=1 Tax=Nocardia mikamii TaxID=508464 RepID=UPI001FE16227